MEQTTDQSGINLDALGKVLELIWAESVAAAEAQSQYPDPQISIQTVAPAILDLVHSYVDSFIATFNARQPIGQLPLEVLAISLSQLSLKDRITASMVSRSWRDAVLSTPAMWADITFDQRAPAVMAGTATASLACLTRQLELSASCPLHLTIWTLEEAPWDSIYLALRDNMHRVSSFRLLVECEDLTSADTNALVKLLSTSAPRLRVFAIVDYSGLMSSFPDNFSFFDNNAPLLKDMQFLGEVSVLRRSGPALKNVERILLNARPFLDKERVGVAFSIFVAAKELMLGFEQWHASEEPSATITPPATLRCLGVYIDEEGSLAVSLLGAIRWELLPRVWVSRRADTALNSEQAFRALTATRMDAVGDDRASSDIQHAFIPRTAAIDWWYEGADPSPLSRGPVVHLYDLDRPMHILLPAGAPHGVDVPVERERIFFELPIPLPSSFFSNVTRLYVRELVFDPDVMLYPMPALPQLVHLTVWVISPAYQGYGLGTSAFLELSIGIDEHESPFAQRWLDCPQLSTLIITASHPEWTPHLRPRLSPDMVRAFIRRHLRYQSRLECLSFVGTELYVDDPRGLDALLGLTETLEGEQRYMAWAANNMPGNASAWS